MWVLTSFWFPCFPSGCRVAAGIHLVTLTMGVLYPVYECEGHTHGVCPFCFAFCSTSTSNKNSSVSLRCACRPVSRGSVSGGTSDGHIVLAGLGLSQGDTSGDATPLYSALGVSEAEMDLKEPFAVRSSLSLLSGSLLDSIAFIDPMARSGRFAQICVSRGSLVTETIKRPPAMQETCVQFPGGEDPLEEVMAPSPVFLPGESHGRRSLAGCGPWGRRVRHDWATSLSLSSVSSEDVNGLFFPVWLRFSSGFLWHLLWR